MGHEGDSDEAPDQRDATPRRESRWKVVTLVAGLVLLLVGFSLAGILRAVRDDRPVATGRPGDACAAKGAAGLVGLDVRTGRVRWENVVGDEVADLWAPRGDDRATRDPGAHAFVLGTDGSVRRVSSASGRVDRCLPARDLKPTDGRTTAVADRSGATARDRAAGAVELREQGGTTVRWSKQDRYLVGFSAGGVVVRSDDGSDDCCSGTAPDLSIEVLDPASGRVRWAATVQGYSAVVTATHVVVVDQFDGVTKAPTIGEVPMRARITAYDLADGREAWHQRVQGSPDEAFAVSGLVVVPGFDGHPTLTAIGEASGQVRWTAALPMPARGGDATEFAGVPEVALSGGTVVAVVSSGPPQRD